MAEGGILFWSEEPTFGCSQPIRAGDLMRVKEHGWGWKEQGKIVVILDVIDPTFTNFIEADPDDLYRADAPEECLVIIDGRREMMRIEYLEPISDQSTTQTR
jgi:hypothetical protein